MSQVCPTTRAKIEQRGPFSAKKEATVFGLLFGVSVDYCCLLGSV